MKPLRVPQMTTTTIAPHDQRRHHVVRLLVVGLLFHLVYIGSVFDFDCYFTSPVVHGMRNYGSGDAVAPSKRLVLIVGTSSFNYSINDIFFMSSSTLFYKATVFVRTFCSLWTCFKIYLVLIHLMSWHLICGRWSRREVLLGSRIHVYRQKVGQVMFPLLVSWFKSAKMSYLCMFCRRYVW